MSITERKEREKQEMRDLILNTAKEMFLKEGYEKTSLRKIANKIDYSPTTIYLYFKDKSDIFHALMEIGFSILLGEFSKAMTIDDPYERLRAIGAVYITFAFENAEFYDLMFIMRSPMEKVHKETDWDAGKRTFMCLQQTVDECIKKKLIKSSNPDTTSLMFWAHVHGLVSLKIRERMIMFPQKQLNQLILETTNELMGLAKR
jgi:Transcriptional regulator